MVSDAACVKCPPGEANEIVHVDCVTHRYPDGTEGIHNMCFRVYEREIVAVCGPNGAGKSTLIEHINGLMMPDVGRVRVFGVDIDKKNVGEIRKKVGLVFQDADSQLFSPTVLEDVMFGPLNLGMSVEDARKRAEWALGVVGIKELNKIPHYLSGGQQRLVAIAGVLAMDPKILVVDEPTGDLDPSNALRIEALLRSLRNEHGISVVVALHDMDMAARLADRICIVKDGAVIAEGKPEDILYDEKLLHSAGLELPDVARLYRDLGLKAKGAKKPLSLDELVSTLKK
ncbi:MAG: ATP-binding cassette domain-containing protein [Thermoplasmatota archaeon]|nr:ATP-binding cassette domain-containing protein [Candidatus Thermoplasmatota archaeon]MBU1914901.1 ATP-binding cassette domain-containing protein [Candidatus Thermoplasmatota archaeon]